MITANSNDLIAFFNQNQNVRIHNLSRGSIYTYFDLATHLKKGDAYLDGAHNLIIGSRVKRIFSFTGDISRRLGGYKIYSAFEPKADFIKSGPFKETMYDLEKVFDPKSYSSAKKRYQRLVRPEKLIEKYDVVFEELTMGNLSMALNLHEQWLNKKKANPKVYQIMLPGQRYARVTSMAANPPIIPHQSFYGRLVRVGGRAAAVRVCSIEDDTAYDLANFGLFDEEFNGFAEVMNFVTLVDLFFGGYKLKFFNCGASGDAKLRAFKSHWPNTDRMSFSGSFLETGEVSKPTKPTPKTSDEPVW